MKRIVVVILSLVVLVSLLVACSKPTDDASANLSANVTQNVTEPTPEQPVTPPVLVEEPTPEEPVFCPMDAKVCPDGTSVGRVAPSCEYAACPEVVVAPAPVQETASSKNKMHVVELRNATFSPERLTIKVGDTVTWKNTRSGYHSKAMIVGSRQCREIRSDIFDSGETFSWTFTKPDECTITDGYITYTKASVITIVE